MPVGVLDIYNHGTLASGWSYIQKIPDKDYVSYFTLTPYNDRLNSSDTVGRGAIYWPTIIFYRSSFNVTNNMTYINMTIRINSHSGFTLPHTSSYSDAESCPGAVVLTSTTITTPSTSASDYSTYGGLDEQSALNGSPIQSKAESSRKYQVGPNLGTGKVYTNTLSGEVTLTLNISTIRKTWSCFAIGFSPACWHGNYQSQQHYEWNIDILHVWIT